MHLYSERLYGEKPRVNEEINFETWKGIVNIIEKMEKRQYFAKEYPLVCRDDRTDIWGADLAVLSQDLKQISFGELSWPLEIKKGSKSDDDFFSSILAVDWHPNTDQAFDLIEFLFSKTCTATPTGDYHSYHRHTHLEFPKTNQAKDEFAKEINDLFRFSQMIYEFDPTTGQIKTILSQEVKSLIVEANNNNAFHFDVEYKQMLNDACVSIASARLEESQRALEKLWDAYERLKCYFDPKDKNEKKACINKILNFFSETPVFKGRIDEEMNNLTTIGNCLKIRHSETYQETLTNHRQINYLFNRCLAMINFIQNEIVVYETKQK